ncbi:hypothetical protein Cpir12675_002874 [Ceratocystis pirilliformis]|uniref:Mid2 domain-containing protein n=1 Tax=Ceratocystis pirilliformis TaxID=259994 RepID=A0ABR3Z6E9_9PEZI
MASISMAGPFSKRQLSSGDVVSVISSLLSDVPTADSGSTSTAAQESTSQAVVSTSSAVEEDVTVTVTSGSGATSTVTSDTTQTITVTVVATVTYVSTVFATSTVTADNVATATLTVYTTVTSASNAKRAPMPVYNDLLLPRETGALSKEAPRAVAVPRDAVLVKRATVTVTVIASDNVVTVVPTSTVTSRRTSTISSTSESTITTTTFINAQTTVTVTSTITQIVASITNSDDDETIAPTATDSTSSSGTSSSSSSSSDSSGLSSGAKAGIGIGAGIGGAILLLLGIWYIMKRRRDRPVVSRDEINGGMSEVPMGQSSHGPDTFVHNFPNPHSASAAAALGINRPDSSSPPLHKNHYAPSPASSPSNAGNMGKSPTAGSPPGTAFNHTMPGSPHAATPPAAGYAEMGADERVEIGEGAPRVHHPNAAEIDSRPLNMTHQSGPVPEVYEMPAVTYK